MRCPNGILAGKQPGSQQPAEHYQVCAAVSFLIVKIPASHDGNIQRPEVIGRDSATDHRASCTLLWTSFPATANSE